MFILNQYFLHQSIVLSDDILFDANQKIDDEAKVERSRGNNLLDVDHNFEGNERGERNPKNLKVFVDGGCSSTKDQVYF